MKKPITPQAQLVPGTKLAPTDWINAFGQLDFTRLSDYSKEYLEQKLKDSWQWYLDHQLCMKFEDVERYTRATRVIKNAIVRLS